jgi:hypothetical protein
MVAVTVPGSYAAGSEQANVYSLLNSEGTRCGFGALQQDAKLDQSAAAHATFLTENGTQYEHDEVAGLPFYTGQTEGARAIAAGYVVNSVGADLATYAGPAGVPDQLRTTEQLRSLFAAPFHLLSLVD